MEWFIFTFFVTIFVITAIGMAATAVFKAPAKALNKKFLSMGNLVGKTFEEITSVVGNPQAVFASPPGSFRTWSAAVYSITLIFDADEICNGVQQEIAA